MAYIRVNQASYFIAQSFKTICNLNKIENFFCSVAHHQSERLVEKISSQCQNKVSRYAAGVT